jgi:hypothetical protein
MLRELAPPGDCACADGAPRYVLAAVRTLAVGEPW